MSADARRRAGRERGSAVVEFAVVVPMLALLVLAVVQVALALHVRSALTAAAAEGARGAAVAGGDLQAGVRRTREAVDATLAHDLVEDVRATTSATGGFVTIDVEVRARLPLVGMLGPASLVVHGHALVEE